MKTIRFLVLILLGYFVFTPFVSAACDAAKKVQLDRDVASIKVNYEILKEAYSGRTDVTNTNEEETFYYDVIQVNIINVTEDFMVEVKSDYDKKTTKYTYKDAKDGIISFKSPTNSKIVNYTFKIKSVAKDGCKADEVTRTLYLTQPRYNYLSDYEICNKIPEYYLCEKYVEFYDDVELGVFLEKANKALEKKNRQIEEEEKANRKWYEKITDYISENKTKFIITGGALVAVIVIGTTAYVIKRRRDVI